VENLSWINDDQFNKLIERFLKSFGIEPFEDHKPEEGTNVRSWRYGYSMTIGPDGKPVVKEWGNMRPTFNPSQDILIQSPQTEPLTQIDVDKETKKVSVLVEMPGLSKDDIEVVAQENVIHIKAHNETRNYDTEIPISVKVDQETAEATYNNGILDLKFTLLETADEDGFNIPVN
jgi:HSP20 family protein